MDEDDEVQESGLLGVVELPATCGNIVEITSLTSGKQLGTRVDRYFLLTADGSGLIVDVVDASFATLGTWSLIANFGPSHIMGSPPEKHIPFYEARGEIYGNKYSLEESKSADLDDASGTEREFTFHPHIIASNINDIDADVTQEARRLKEVRTYSILLFFIIRHHVCR